MPLTVPILDDRTYRDLVEEGLRLVASGDGEWTNRNPSDPGVTLLELLAYFSELLIYRASQVGDDDLRAFARLLSPAGAQSPDMSAADQLAAAVRAARVRERVVSRSDFEEAATSVDQRIARAHCVPDRDLTRGTAAARRAVRPGHVTVLIIPYVSSDLQEVSALCDTVLQHIESRRLLTTRVHVGTPEYVEVSVRLAVTTTPGALVAKVREQTQKALTRFLDPATGGTDGRGWPLGRSVFVSELYQLVDRLPGVDYVTQTLDPDTGEAQDELVVTNAALLERNDRSALSERRIPPTGELVGLSLAAHEIVRTAPDGHVLQVRSAQADVSATTEE